jgi:predicted nucleotidyltransferase
MAQKAGTDRAAVLAAVVEHIRSVIPATLAIYRYGSWGTEAERADSDLDIAILPAGRALDATTRLQLMDTLGRIAGRDVDVADLRSADTVFRAQVVSNGERIFASDERACGAFEDFVYSDYGRLNEERRLILRDIRERGSIYGG